LEIQQEKEGFDIMNIVISQPMYFPWAGMFEQIRLCDKFIFYDDVQFSKGSFTNRVQVKSQIKEGFKWLTVPLKNFKLGIKINEVEIDNTKDWKNQHLELLKQSYQSAPFYGEMKNIVYNLFNIDYSIISELSQKSMELIIDYFEIKEKKQFYISSQLNIQGNSSQRVFDLVKYFQGKKYITGHGARNYLDHELFERSGIEVEYMDYKRSPYTQLHGEFNPHVSILDLIANKGMEGKSFIISNTKKWREFLYES
jgi:WbqC-like protein family